MNTYRVKIQHDDKRLGQTFTDTGTIRNLMLQQLGYLELLGSEPDPVERRIDEPPVGTTRPTGRKRRGKQAEAGPGTGEVIPTAPGESARGQDGPADRDGSQEASSGEEAGPTA
jgi:hypothetical protein